MPRGNWISPPAKADHRRSGAKAKAIEACQKHVEATLEGEYRVDPLEADLEWDPISLRHVYDQPLEIWRAYGAFEVLLDVHDRPIGFVDEDTWLFCGWRELPPAEAEALARATGLVPTGLSLAESVRGEKECLELVFTSGTSAATRVRVRINPRRKAVISVEPEAAAP